MICETALKKKHSLIYGVGINDANYVVKQSNNGVRTYCKYYSDWMSMLQRGYSSLWKNKYPSYQDVYVVEAWHTFSTFRDWVISYENRFGIDANFYHLDKDLILPRNTTYGPEFCAYVDSPTNKCIGISQVKSGNLPFGVYFERCSGKYKAQIKDYSKNQTNLGRYDTAEEAHRVWQKAKHRVLKDIANKQFDFRVKSGILIRVDTLMEDYKRGIETTYI